MISYFSDITHSINMLK
ncbi:CRISPR-associated DxTHG motif protein [Pseudoalteromonas sp. JC28]|nr:CRISPR-associated DxTHG motif protein [Pseudoalteromonas sp. JC28]